MDIRKESFTVEVMRHWHRLPREVVDVPFLKKFKVRLNRALSNPTPAHYRGIGVDGK